ncbi:MAG: urease accessory UreF family protein [Pseudomonadota bacterium]
MSAPLLKVLQFADSSFPTGAFGFSWGLESAIEAGMVTRGTFQAWLEAEMLDRWASFDRIILAEAWRQPFDAFAAYEADIDLLFWSDPLRASSLTAGRAFLTGAARFGDPVAEALKDMCETGATLGHLSSAQGAVFSSQGLPLNLCLAAAAHSSAQALVSAAVRLALISAIEGQRIYRIIQPQLAEAITTPMRGSQPASFAPLGEIAMLTPPKAPLFIN